MELAGLASRSGPNAAGFAAGIGPLLWSLSVAAAAISLARHLNRAEHGCQASDASYVALAELLDCNLLTADARLSRAPGIRCPITVVPR